MMYRRLLSKIPGEGASQKAKFRHISHRNRKYQLSGIFVAAFYSIWLKGGDEVTERIREWREQEGVDIMDDESVIWWLGQKVEYGGMEMNKMAQIMQVLVQED
jgi:hypothetical protein